MVEQSQTPSFEHGDTVPYPVTAPMAAMLAEDELPWQEISNILSRQNPLDTHILLNIPQGHIRDGLYVMEVFGIHPDDTKNIDQQLTEFRSIYSQPSIDTLEEFTDRFIIYCGVDSETLDMNLLERRLVSTGIFAVFGEQDVQALVKDLIRTRAVLLAEERDVLLHRQVSQAMVSPMQVREVQLLENERQKEIIDNQAAQIRAEIFNRQKDRDPQIAREKIARVKRLMEERRQNGLGKIGKTVQETIASPHGSESFQDENIAYSPPTGELLVITDVHGLLDFESIFEKHQVIEKILLGEDITVVFAGDFVDKGPEQAQVVEALLDLISFSGAVSDRIIVLQADHDMKKGVSHDFGKALFDAYIPQSQNASTMIAALSGQNTSFNPGEYVRANLKIPAGVTIQGGLSVDTQIVPYILESLIHTLQHNDTPIVTPGVLPEQEKTLQSYVDKVKENLGSNGGVYDEYFTLFDLFPKFFVKKDILVAHGGTPFKVQDLQSLKGDEKAVAEATWADPIPEDRKALEIVDKKERKAYMQQLLQSGNGASTFTYVDDLSIPEEKVIIPGAELEEAVSILDQPEADDIEFNVSRVHHAPRQLNTIRKRMLLYSGVHVKNFLEAIGTKILVRGHQPSDSKNLNDNILFDGKVVWVHSTFPGVRTYAYFPDVSQNIEYATTENIRYFPK